MNVATLLSNTLSPDQAIREDATQQLELAAQENYSAYVLMLSQELANEGADPNIRTAAGLAVKNSLTAKEASRKEDYINRWLSVDENTRSQIKQWSVNTLGSSNSRAAHTSAQVVAAIADIELPVNQWPQLIQSLLDNVTSSDNPLLRQASLVSIGFVCETTNPDVLKGQANDILTAVIQGARKEEENQEVRLAAVRALYNSLEFIRENFESESERNIIMMVVCEATQSTEEQLQVAAFECLVRIMQLYYDCMLLYMEKALFALTVVGMNNEETGVALQAIEFWSTVCDEEIELQLHAEEAADAGEQPHRISHGFARSALPQILPVLLFLLTKQEEDEDEDEWNVSMAAATCLNLFAQCVGDSIVGPIVPFVESNISNEDWRYREAAVMAFGSILDGPTPDLLIPLVDQALPLLIQMMKDPVVNVKDTVAWTLGRVSDYLPQCIKPEVHLQDLITALVLGLQDSPRIVANCCWSLMNLAEHIGGGDDLNTPTCPLSMYFEGIVGALLQFTDRQNNEANCRTSAYEALSTLVGNAAMDCLTTVQQVIVATLDRLETTIAVQNQIIGVDDSNAHAELQSNLLSVLTSCIRKLSTGVSVVSDRVMTVLLQMLSTASKQSSITEDVFLAVGSLTAALDSDFSRYVEPFAPHLYSALQNPDEHQLCAIAIGLIGDICRALGEASFPYCQTFMELLITNLQSPVLHSDVKPAILSCFGDIALAIGAEFEPFLDLVMLALQQVGGMRAEKDNWELMDYVVRLHEGSVEAYVGIVQGLGSGQKIHLLAPHVPAIFGFLGMVTTEDTPTETLVRSTVGLIGDFADAFQGGELKQYLAADWVMALIREARSNRHYSDSTREVARWAKEMVKRATNGL
ncbi:unnamed protein product [Umbelopsis ramanniana]